MNKKAKILIVVLSVLSVVSIIGTVYFASAAKKYSGYLDEIKIREEENSEQYVEEDDTINWYTESWNNCLKQMAISADAVFFGDSITFDGDFQSMFPDKMVVNLGVPGNGISELINRANQVALVNPKKVFVLAGINGLKEDSLEYAVAKYKELINTLKEQNPEAEIYVQSVLPVSVDKELSYVTNDIIMKFNDSVKAMASECRIEYVDLHSVYYKNKQMDPKATRDGIHLKAEAYDRWVKIIKPLME